MALTWCYAGAMGSEDANLAIKSDGMPRSKFRPPRRCWFGISNETGKDLCYFFSELVQKEAEVNFLRVAFFIICFIYYPDTIGRTIFCRTYAEFTTTRRSNDYFFLTLTTINFFSGIYRQALVSKSGVTVTVRNTLL